MAWRFECRRDFALPALHEDLQQLRQRLFAWDTALVCNLVGAFHQLRRHGGGLPGFRAKTHTELGNLFQVRHGGVF
jgi:hypothetical protein